MEPVEGDKLPPSVTSQTGTPLAGEPMQTVIEALNEQAGGGGSLGFPLLNIKVTVIGGELHETETSEIALRVAAADAFNKGLQAGGIVLLEPIMKLEITTPEEYLGDFVSDLQQRRATIQHTENRSSIIAVDAQAPLANLFGYSSAMRSLSQGRGSCSMQPHSYAAAPPEVLKKFL